MRNHFHHMASRPHNGHAHARDHVHGAVDPSIVTTRQGIWAVKWSFIVLAMTAFLQLAVVYISGSVALLADTVHNVGDAATAMPLWVAFRLARRPPSLRFGYGYGRAEDLAGVIIVLVISASAIFAGYEAVTRLIDPRPITHLGWVALAGVIGFIGNEGVAILRIRIGRRINSAALIADGYHARADGLTSLAVVGGAAGVWLGFPLADPVIGLAITVAIFGILWQSAKLVLGRLLDSVDAAVIAQLRHALRHVPEVRQVLAVRARWLGHRLNADIDVAVDPTITVAQTDIIAAHCAQALRQHAPTLAVARICLRPHHGAEPPHSAPRIAPTDRKIQAVPPSPPPSSP
ncbi:MAG: cation diffusion facilitator family transporter [Pseudomonadota bacterium]